MLQKPMFWSPRFTNLAYLQLKSDTSDRHVCVRDVIKPVRLSEVIGDDQRCLIITIFLLALILDTHLMKSIWSNFNNGEVEVVNSRFLGKWLINYEYLVKLKIMERIWSSLENNMNLVKIRSSVSGWSSPCELVMSSGSFLEKQSEYHETRSNTAKLTNRPIRILSSPTSR